MDGKCIESIRDRLNWHINDTHTETRVKYGTLSTLRQSIASIIAHNQYDKKATDDFIDKLEVEYFFNEQPIKSANAKNELTCIDVNDVCYDKWRNFYE